MMKKLMSIVTAFLFVFTLVSCSGDDSSGSSSSESSSSEPQILTDCKSIGLENFNEDTRPEEFEKMNIPSNKEMSDCICEKIIAESPNMTNEELTAFWTDDLDPQSEEGEERMQITIKCMGFDSMDDYMSTMMQMMQSEMELE
jgi:hypothetical protein